MAEPFGGMPTRWDPPEPTARVAVVLPGAGYSPNHPLLFFTMLVLLEHGWTVQQVWWDKPRLDAEDEATRWVQDQASAALAAEQEAEDVLVVGKSLGSRAAGLVADRGLPAIWLTPLLVLESCAGAIRRATAPRLLVGGTADQLWDSRVAGELGAEVLEVEGADHALVVDGDPVATARAHVAVVERVDRFLTALGA